MKQIEELFQMIKMLQGMVSDYQSMIERYRVMNTEQQNTIDKLRFENNILKGKQNGSTN